MKQTPEQSTSRREFMVRGSEAAVVTAALAALPGVHSEAAESKETYGLASSVVEGRCARMYEA